jgi:hypothetical protein
MIVTDEGTHLLIARGEQHAVIERRNGRFYNCHDDRREGVPAEDLAAVEQILSKDDWTDSDTARTIFEQAVSRGTQLAQHML